MQKKPSKPNLRLIVNLLALAVFAGLAIAYFTDNLGVNPIRKVQHLSGDIAMVCLLVSLSITPLRTVTGISWISPVRKTFGLLSFYYAALHVLIYIGLDYRFNLPDLIQSIGFRKYIWVGLAAFLILSVLAVTSLRKVKTMVKKAWKKIHSFVYLAGILVVLHYAWNIKGVFLFSGGGMAWPLIATIYLALLLILRLKPVKNAVLRMRGKANPAAANEA